MRGQGDWQLKGLGGCSDWWREWGNWQWGKGDWHLRGLGGVSDWRWGWGDWWRRGGNQHLGGRTIGSDGEIGGRVGIISAPGCLRCLGLGHASAGLTLPRPPCCCGGGVPSGGVLSTPSWPAALRLPAGLWVAFSVGDAVAPGQPMLSVGSQLSAGQCLRRAGGRCLRRAASWPSAGPCHRQVVVWPTVGPQACRLPAGLRGMLLAGDVLGLRPLVGDRIGGAVPGPGWSVVSLAPPWPLVVPWPDPPPIYPAAISPTAISLLRLECGISGVCLPAASQLPPGSPWSPEAFRGSTGPFVTADTLTFHLSSLGTSNDSLRLSWDPTNSIEAPYSTLQYLVTGDLQNIATSSGLLSREGRGLPDTDRASEYHHGLGKFSLRQHWNIYTTQTGCQN